MSNTRNANALTGARSGGRNRQTPGPAQAGPAATAFPQPLPARVARLVDGVNVVGIQVLYTKYGMTVSVVKADNSLVPLERFEAEAKQASERKVLDEDIKQYATRIAERKLDLAPPAPGISRQELEEYLQQAKASKPDVFKLLVMTNRNFRAQQGANAAQPANQ